MKPEHEAIISKAVKLYQFRNLAAELEIELEELLGSNPAAASPFAELNASAARVLANKPNPIEPMKCPTCGDSDFACPHDDDSAAAMAACEHS